MITLEELKLIIPGSGRRAEIFLPYLNKTMDEFDISQNGLREAAFLAQLAHESGSFQYVKELASGLAYENREDLGNTEQGDGVKYKGRGLIQITGKANYLECGEYLTLDLLNKPELLELPENACLSAGWFWNKKHLNDLADKGDFLTITKRINGGTNGYQNRLAFYERALEILGS